METMTVLKDLEADRSVVYRCLADAYRRPSQSLAATIETLVSALSRLDSAATQEAARLEEKYAETADALLEIEYTRLFIGPFVVPAPPYGSIYLEKKRSLMGESTMDARRRYLQAGLDLSPDFKEAPDHIVAELEFMHALIARSLEAMDALNDRRLIENIRQQHMFLSGHLGAWIPAFTAKVRENAGSGVYRHLAQLTRLFIAEDMAALPDPAELPLVSAEMI